MPGRPAKLLLALAAMALSQCTGQSGDGLPAGADRTDTATTPDAAGGSRDPRQPPDTGSTPSAEAAVRALVVAFGHELRRVSLLAPPAQVEPDLRAAYAPYVTPGLLERWLADPAAAPGRTTSSPWPARIGIDGLEPAGNGYRVSGRVVLMTSVELSAGHGAAGYEPVTLTVEPQGNGWRIADWSKGAAPADGGALYRDPDGRFTLRFPAGEFTALGPDREADAHATSVIPPCDDGFLACIAWRGAAFEGTNFDSAGVAVFAPDAASAVQCRATRSGAVPGEARQETVGGLEFTTYTTGEGAMSHASHDDVWLTWDGARCWQLVARIGSTRLEVYEPGRVEAFSDADREQLRAVLRDILGSFAPAR